MITYKRPKTIGRILTNYKHHASSKTREPVTDESGPCGHCALCGCYGKHDKSMVPRVSQTMSKTETFPLNQNLTCRNYGIYVVTFVLCHEQYVAQTKNKFSKRWSADRSNWNRPNCSNDINKEVALSRHYAFFHGNVNKPPIHEAYIVTFVEQPNFHSLNICDDKWYHQIDTQINIHSMILPRVR